MSDLLKSKGGWDASASFDPVFQPDRFREVTGIRGEITQRDVIQYMLTRPLQFTPGERAVWSNFGLCAMARVLEKASGKSYYACVQETILHHAGINDVQLARSARAARPAREVSYPVSDDAVPLELGDGLIASAPALCRFMQVYWLNGSPRLPNERLWSVCFGDFPGTMAVVRQRDDGLNFAVLLNGRRADGVREDQDLTVKSVDDALGVIMGNKQGSSRPSGARR